MDADRSLALNCDAHYNGQVSILVPLFIVCPYVVDDILHVRDALLYLWLLCRMSSVLADGRRRDGRFIPSVMDRAGCALDLLDLLFT